MAIRVRCILAVSALGTGLLAAPAASAQAILRGYIVTDSLALPIAQAEVLIEELGRSAITSERGFFRLTGIPVGRFTLRVRRIGFRSAVAPLRIESPDSATIQITLPPWIPELEPLLVTAPKRTDRVDEIEERHRLVGGRLIRYGDLRKNEYATLEELLRKEGVTIFYDSSHRPHPVSPRAKRMSPNGGAAICTMAVFLDGAAASDDLSQYVVESLAAVEVFKSSVESPVQYHGVGNSCGLILIWTRDR